MQQLEINPVGLHKYINYLEKQIPMYISVEDTIHLKSILRIPEDLFFYSGIDMEEDQEKQKIARLSNKLFGEKNEQDERILEIKKNLYETICINGTKTFNSQLDKIIGSYLTDNLIQIIESIPRIINLAMTTLVEINQIPQALESCLKDLSKSTKSTTKNNAVKNSIKDGYEALRGIY